MRSVLGVALAPLALVALVGVASGHEGHAHKVMGTVAAVTAEQIEIVGQDGKKAAFVLTKTTVFKKDANVAALKDVTVGSRVVLSSVEKDGKKSITEVLIGVVDKKTHDASKH
jgi:hypothetical protein